jgi:phosphohistidine phosphatase
MRIWLLRHGHAEPHSTQDSLRQLTGDGRREVLLSAAELVGRPLGAILSSPYVRARQTAELVAEALNSDLTIEIVPWLAPDVSVKEALDCLAARHEGELLLVSHQPLVGELAGLLEHGHRQQPLAMRTAALAAFDGLLPAAGGMTLAVHFLPNS